MTREEATKTILGWAGAVEMEFCVGEEEHRKMDQEVADVLEALGLEMPDYSLRSN